MNTAPPDGNITNQRRFVDVIQGRDPVADLHALARMMDEFKTLLQQQAAQRLDYAFSPVAARALVRCRIGTLVFVNPNGTLSLADKATNQLASGVVVTDEGSLVYKWSPLAFLRLVIPDADSSGEGTIYLSNSGLIQATRPTVGTIQTVGFQYGYDAQTNSTLSLVCPGFHTYAG